jgi:mono/diheme cytochrome c family protein
MKRPTLFACLTALTLVACTPTPAAKTPDTKAPGNTPTSAEPITFRLAIAPVITRSCAGCHNPGGSGSSKFVCFNAAGEVDHAGLKAGVTEAIRSIESGRMPRGTNPRLSSQELAALKSWQTAGAPNN